MEICAVSKQFMPLEDFLKNLKSTNLEIREKKFFINPQEKLNYLFNSSIVGIEKSDLILLIGCNPRHEATMVNARIRKAFVKNKVPIYSIGNPGDLTYEYKIAGDRSEDIKNIFEEKNEISKILKKAKKPMVIIGESALETKSGGFIFEGFKEFLNINGFINENGTRLMF